MPIVNNNDEDLWALPTGEAANFLDRLWRCKIPNGCRLPLPRRDTACADRVAQVLHRCFSKLALLDFEVMPFHSSESLVQVRHVLLPCATADEDVVQVDDRVVKPLENVLHQS